MSYTHAKLQQLTASPASGTNQAWLKGENVRGRSSNGVQLHIQLHLVNLLISPGVLPKSNQWGKVEKNKKKKQPCFPSSRSSPLFPLQFAPIKQRCRRLLLGMKCSQLYVQRRSALLTLSPAARAGVQVVWIEPVGSVHLGQQLSDVHHLQTATNTAKVSGKDRASQSLQDSSLCICLGLWSPPVS